MFTIQTTNLSRAEALRRIRLLSGKDLRPLAEQYGVTVWKNGRKNKGWAGQVIEQYLGLPQNSLQAPDFGSWELKVVPLIRACGRHGARKRVDGDHDDRTRRGRG